MVFTKKAKTFKKPRTFKKKAPMYKAPKYNQGIFKIKRYTSPNNMTLQARSAGVGSFSQSNGYFVATTGAAGATPAYFSWGFAFCLADLPDYTEFTNLWDQFRIAGVKVRVLPVNCSSEFPTATNTVTNGGFIHAAPDQDDYNAPTTSEAGINELRSKTGYKMRSLQNYKGIQMYIRPTTATPVYGAGAFSQYAQSSRKLWMDCANANQQYYGQKGVIEIIQQGSVALNYYFKIEAVYYIQLKSVR